MQFEPPVQKEGILKQAQQDMSRARHAGVDARRSVSTSFRRLVSKAATDSRLCGGITGQGRKNEPLNAALPSCELNAAAP
ncbi:MAG: hypothetical protein ABIR35_04465 [Polaromonas sp.]